MELEPLNIWAAIAVLAFVSAAVVTDLKWLRIPNWLTVPAFLIAIVFYGLTDGWSGLFFSFGGFATGFGILFLLWVIGGGGGGDVKLMGAVGAWVGALPVLAIFIGSAIFAVMCTIVMMATNRVNGQRVLQTQPSNAEAAPTHARNNPLKQHVPYAVPVAMATACVVLALQLIKT
jgi:prepilin peptidase CpaA